MFASGPDGFYKAPVTKGILTIVGGMTVITSILQSKFLFFLQWNPFISHHFQFWRLGIHHFVFMNTGETIFGCLLIYTFRLFERRYGSSKFAAYALTTSVLSTVIQVGLLALLQVPIPASPGPYGLIFASLVQFYLDIPVSSTYNIFGLTISMKFFPYLFGFQMLISSYPSSVISAISGLIAGFLYHQQIGGIHKWRLPSFILSLSKKLLLPIFSSDPPRYTFPGSESRRTGIGGIGGAMGGERYELPTEGEIQALESMGFARPAVLAALRATNNDVNAAATRLLANTQSTNQNH